MNTLKDGRHEDKRWIFWTVNGEIHREDGPAVEWINGAIFPIGTKEWRIHGKRHREDGPAVVYPDRHEEHWINGKLSHVESYDGKKEWWINGQQFTEEQFNQWFANKDLNEKLQSTLPERPKDKKNKI